MAKSKVVTFGCRLNAQESEVIGHNLDKVNLDDVIVINSCAVTNEAVRQARQAIRKNHRLNPGQKIIVTGCAAQISPEIFAEMPEVSAVIGNNEKLQESSYRNLSLNTQDKTINVGDIAAVRTLTAKQGCTPQKSRAFIQIQNGCDHRCTFCIIPYGRGSQRSLAPQEVISQIRDLVVNGWREVVLTGVNIASYGGDLTPSLTLGRLVQKILLAIPELPRLRLSSLDPAQVDYALLDAIGSEMRLMPHIHLSVQAGDDMVLKRMKRRHLRHDIIDLCARLRELRPGIAIGGDMIAGFPTESAQMAKRSFDLVGEAGLVYLHVFPFSPRPGTPAARMPQVAPGLARQRAAILREIAMKQRSAYFKGEIGQKRMVLIEKTNSGHSEHFAPVEVIKAPGDHLGDGALLATKIIDANKDRLYALLEG